MQVSIFQVVVLKVGAPQVSVVYENRSQIRITLTRESSPPTQLLKSAGRLLKDMTQKLYPTELGQSSGEQLTTQGSGEYSMAV